MKESRSNLVICAVLVTAFYAWYVCGGSLEPSSPPGPTMKTLAQIDPGTVITSVPYVISESGRYYLAADAKATSSMFHGITIWAGDVTLDLKGFSLVGEGTARRHGIVIEGDHNNITICNGRVMGWGGSAIVGATATRCRVEALQVVDNGVSAIDLPGNEQIVRDCLVSGNGNDASADVNCIYVGDCSAVTDCTVSHNADDADGDVYGIHVGRGGTIRGNSVSYTGISANGDYVYAIYAGEATTVIGNTAYDNGDIAYSASVYGIYLTSRNLVDQNVAYDHGFAAASSENMDMNVVGCVYGHNVAP